MKNQSNPASKHKKWYLNGIEFAEFRGLPDKSIDSLVFVAEFYGVKVFTSSLVPKGTLELREDNCVIAIIEGISL